MLKINYIYIINSFHIAFRWWFSKHYTLFLISDDTLRCSPSPEADGYKGCRFTSFTHSCTFTICRCCDIKWAAACPLTLGFLTGSTNLLDGNALILDKTKFFWQTFGRGGFSAVSKWVYFANDKGNTFFCDAQVTWSTTKCYYWWREKQRRQEVLVGWRRTDWF